MSYPKPLSEKSLEKLYLKSGLSDEDRSFLHKTFSACANLYGAIDLRSLWTIYRELENAPKIRRKDLVAFSMIARREIQPYYVYEVDEIYNAERRTELERIIVNRELVSFGYGKFSLLYRLMEQIDNKPYCIPKNFFSFSSTFSSKEELNLLSFLSNMISTADECAPKHGKSIPNDHKGKKLSEFSFLNSAERFEAEWFKRPSARGAFLEDCSGTEAEKILRFFKRIENIGDNRLTGTLQWILDELKEVGVLVEEKQVEELLHLITDYHNNSRLWCLSGWKPNELAGMYREDSPASISFGPGMQKAFSEGSLDKDELVKKFQEMGLTVVE